MWGRMMIGIIAWRKAFLLKKMNTLSLFFGPETHAHDAEEVEENMLLTPKFLP